MKHSKVDYLPYLLLTLANLFFGFNLIIAKVVTVVIPPITLTFLRWQGCLFFLLPFCWRELKTNYRIFLANWPLFLALGAIGYSSTSALAYEAVHYSTAINASFINAFMPIMVAITAYIMYREPVTRLQTVGFVLSLIGVVWIVFHGDWTHVMKLKMNIGDLFMILNVSTWPIFPSLFKHRASDLPRLATFAAMIIAGLLVTIPPMIVENLACHGGWIHHVRWEHILGLLGLCIFPSLLANHFQNTALNYISTNKVGVFQALIAVFASIIAVLFLGEKFYFYHLFGGLLILSGVFLVVKCKG